MKISENTQSLAFDKLLFCGKDPENIPISFKLGGKVFTVYRKNFLYFRNVSGLTAIWFYILLPA